MRKTTEDELAYVGQNCDDPLVNAYYVGVHAISKERYEQMIGRYFRDKRPREYQVYSSELNVQLPCKNHIVKFIAGRDRTHNEDVKVWIQEVKKFDGKYSIHFFRGTDRFFVPKRYEFSKAIGKKGKTLVVRVIDKNDPYF